MGNDFENRVRELLLANGADVVGFATAEPFTDWGEVFRSRLSDGRLPRHYAGTLSHDPGNCLPGARSIMGNAVP